MDENRKISQVDLNLDHRELERVEASINARWLTEGPNVAELEQKIKDMTGARFAAFAPNGTLGLFLSLLGLDLPRDSEILIPSFTFYASATSAIFAGLKPVFVDVDRETFGIDLQDLERKISDKTTAIMPVHMYGQSCDISGVVEIARKYNLKVLEDAAQGFGVYWGNDHVGTIGDIGMISFFSDKVITMGEGSVLLIQDETLYRKIRLLRNQGRPNAGTFLHPELGMNFRITDLQAGIALVQLEKFAEIRDRRVQLWKWYQEELSGVGDIGFMKIYPESNIVPFRFPITTERRDHLAEVMTKNGIQTRNFFHAMHLQPKLKKQPVEDLPNSEWLTFNGLCLPVHHHITDEDVEYIVDTIKSAY